MTKKLKRTPKSAKKNRAWIQVRISPELHRAVQQLKRGEVARITREALLQALREARIALRPRKPDKRQATLPWVRP